MSQPQFIDLYNGAAIDIWMDEEDGMVTIDIHGRISISLDKEDFQELYNAVFISKQVLKEKESNR